MFGGPPSQAPERLPAGIPEPPRIRERPRILERQGRLPELDALRGLAVVGIVLMNVFAFAMPGAAYYNPRAWGGEGPLELALNRKTEPPSIAISGSRKR